MDKTADKQTTSRTVLDEPTPAMLAQPMLLHGSDQYGRTGTVCPVYYPGDGVSMIGSYHRAEPLHMEFIERAAEQGFAQFRKSSPSQRADILERLSAKISENAEAFATLITKESGKPITLAQQEVERAAEICKGYAVEVLRREDRCPVVKGFDARIARYPIGPVLAITPYNFPLSLVVHKLAPAIAAGCSITIKPAPQTSMTALHLGRLAVEAGYDAISVVPSDAAMAGTLVQSSSFSAISFTGSASVGWKIRQTAGYRPVTLELGGNAAVIIEDADDLQAVANRVAFGAFAYSGQICISVQRILINEALKDSFIPALVQATRDVKVGDPFKLDTIVGPMIHLEHMQRTRALLRETLQAGGNVMYGGNTFNAFTLNPTLLDRTTPEMKINTEEAFAPIATVMTYNTFNDAIALVNKSRYGIHAGVYTQNPQLMQRAYDELEVSGVLINEIPTFRADALPYGGVKASGIGREGVLAGIDEFTYVKTLMRKLP